MSRARVTVHVSSLKACLSGFVIIAFKSVGVGLDSRFTSATAIMDFDKYV